MISLTAVLAAGQLVVAEPPALGDAAFDARMKASAAAAQALQGSWDGTWVLSDSHGRRLFVFQITDRADGGPIAGAWREAGDAGRTGWIDAIVRRGDGLEMSFTPAAQKDATVIRLKQRGAQSAMGWMDVAGPKRKVTLAPGP